MTKGDLNGFRILNRPVKPVAFGFTGMMVTICILNLIDFDHFEDNVLGDFVAVLCAISAGLLIAGWIGKKQWAAEYGLLTAAAVYVIRGSFVGLLYGPSSEGLWLSLWAATIAGGAFLLERLDTHPTRKEWFIAYQKANANKSDEGG